ncbi:hypothetical protein Z985_17685 [Salmonella enterica subsp. enterica]|nr:hypothetical protein [Salmonella enterica subsp. enterica]
MSIIDLNTADIFNAIGGGSPLSIINAILHPQYVIRYNGTGFEALEFSGMASIQSGGSAQITNAPVEKGQYQSINKVREPNRVRCSVIITGLSGYSGSIPDIFSLTLTSQSDALRTIQVMLKTTGLYDIETPKETLTGYDLVDYEYEVNSQRGVSMLTVYLVFQEVIQQMEVVLSGSQTENKPSNDAISQGATGMGSDIQQAAAKPSTLDSLSKSWSSLKKSVGDIATNATDTITTEFKSALDTVSEPVLDIANSATEKLATLAKDISANITGPAGK